MIERSSSSTLRGILWMIVTGLMFVGVTSLVKYLGPDMPAAEAAFLRYALGLVLLVPMLGSVFKSNFSQHLMRLFVYRGVAHVGAVFLWFFAMARIPLADVTAMNYLSPIYVTLGAALFLGEKLALRRVIAVGIALVGALIILRPGIRSVDMGHLAMLLAAVFFACSYLLTKRLSDQTSAGAIVVMLSLFVTLGLAPMAWMVWVPPSTNDLLILFGVACFATLGHYTMTLAFAAAPVNITQPVTFLQLVWAVSVGMVFFDEPLDPWVVVGGGTILASVSFISWREAVLQRRLRTPPVPATKV